MDALKRRPLLCATFGWVAGISFAAPRGPYAFLAALILSAFAMAILIAETYRHRFGLLSAVLLYAALGCYTGGLAALPAYSAAAAGYETFGLYGEVASAEKNNGRTTIVLKSLKDKGGLKLGGKAAYTIRGEIGVEAGNWVYIGSSFKAIDMTQLSWMGKGVFYTAYGGVSPVIVIDRRVSFFGYLWRVRNYCEGVINDCCGDVAPLMHGLVLGYRGEMPQFTQEAFKRAGITHILAVSGMHIVFIAVIMNAVLTLLRLRGILRFLAEALLLFGYAMLTGGSPPAMRATFMYLIFRLGAILGRRVDSLTTLSTSLIAITIISPLAVFDVGLELSFLSVLGITLLMPRFDGWFKKLPARIRESVAMTLSATAGTLPVSVNTFGTISLVGIFVNIVAVPLSGVLTILGTAMLLIGLVFRPVGILLGEFVRGLAYLMIAIAHYSARVPFAEAELKAQSFFSVVCYALALLSLSHYTSLSGKERAAAFTSFAALSAVTWGVKL